LPVGGCERFDDLAIQLESLAALEGLPKEFFINSVGLRPWGIRRQASRADAIGLRTRVIDREAKEMQGWNRLRGLDRSRWSDEVQGMLAGTQGPVGQLVGGETQGTLNILLQLAHHPEALRPFLGFATALALRGVLTRRDHELVSLRAIWHCQSDFEWGHHVVFGRVAGLTDAEIDRIPSGPTHPAWNEADRLLLLATDELCRTHTVTDATWARLRDALTDAQLVELPLLVGVYTMLSMVANATGVPLEPGFPPLPRAVQRA
jgi:alkylhydroperoxidase family enzyme